MRGIGLLVRFSLLFLLSSVVFAQPYPDEHIDSTWYIGLESIVREDYEKATLIFDGLNEQYPNLPIANIYKANIEVVRAVDYEIEFDEDYISAYYDRANDICDSLLDLDEENLWYNNFKGLTETSYAYFRALNGNYFSAFDHGMNAFEHYEKCLEIDTSFHDAKYIFGAFKFWKSFKANSIDWLPVIDDETDEGINLLEAAYKKGRYSRFISAENLAWAYYSTGDTAKAITLTENILNEYPESKHFKLVLARLLFNYDDTRQLKVFQECLKEYQQLGDKTIVKQIMLKHYIAQTLNRTKQFELALYFCNDILDASKNGDPRFDRIEERLERVEELRYNLIEKLNLTQNNE